MIDSKILEFAQDISSYGLKNTSKKFASIKNKKCGDKIKVELEVKNKIIKNMRYETESCIFCQASASVLSNFSINNKISNIDKAINFFETFFQNDETKIPKEFKKFKVLFHKSNLSRKECILLPFKALNKALKS